MPRPDDLELTCLHGSRCARIDPGVLLGPETGSERPHHHALAPALSTAIPMGATGRPQSRSQPAGEGQTPRRLGGSPPVGM